MPRPSYLTLVKSGAPCGFDLPPVAFSLPTGALHKRDLPAFLRLVADQAIARKRGVTLSPGFVRALADRFEFGGDAA